MRFIRPVCFSFLACLIAAGCGGGGGSSSVTVAVSSSWAASPASGVPIGVSERITVHPVASPSTVTTTVNLSSSASVQISNVSLAPGSYVFHVDLYSGAAETGTITGSLDAVIDTSATKQISIAEGLAISSITLAEASSTVVIGTTSYVYAQTASSGGAITFASPTDLSFSATSTSVLTAAKDGSDTSAGDLVGVTSGSTTTVQATAASTSVSSAPSSFVVTSSSSTKSWTIMVFLNASNNLAPYALPNYLQMQAAALNGTNAQIIVAWKESKGNTNNSGGYDWSFSGADDTRYYLVKGSSGNSIVGSPIKDLGAGVDFGTTGPVNTFIAYCKKNYPANHYLLDMWDHGDGWQEYLKKRTKKPLLRGISYDFETNNHIDSSVMDQCFTGGNNVDILSYDACNMQMLECGYQVRNYVNYIVGSEDTTPGAGYDYSVALLPYFNNSTGAPATLAQGFVDQMINDTASGGVYVDQAICQSVVQANQLNAVASAVDAFGVALLANKTAVTSIVDNARSTAKNFDDVSNPYNMYYDAVSLATTIHGATGVPTAVATAATNVLTAVQASVLYNRYDLSNLDAGSAGLAVDFSNATTFNSAQGGSIPPAATQYAALAFAKDYPHWYDWLLVAP